jgi:hypothetical protein
VKELLAADREELVAGQPIVAGCTGRRILTRAAPVLIYPTLSEAPPYHGLPRKYFEHEPKCFFHQEAVLTNGG